MTIVAVGTDAALAERFGLACHDAGWREGREAHVWRIRGISPF